MGPQDIPTCQAPRGLQALQVAGFLGATGGKGKQAGYSWHVFVVTLRFSKHGTLLCDEKISGHFHVYWLLNKATFYLWSWREPLERENIEG